LIESTDTAATMKSVPFLNASGSTTSAPVPKAGSGQPSDTSFGQVFAQHSNSNVKNDASATPASSSTQSSADTGAGAAQQAGGTTGTSGTSGTPANGKSKSARDKNTNDTGNTDANAAGSASDPSTANGSAQLLALVSNIQQPITADGSVTTTTTDASAALSAISADAGSAQAALANFQASVAGAASAAANADSKLAGTASMKETLTNAALDGKNVDATNSAVIDNPAGTGVNADGKSATPQPALDLAAAAEKDVAAGLAALDAAAARSTSAVQSAAAAAAAAIPAAQTVVQTGIAATQAVGATDKLTPQVGSPGWDQALGQKVVWMVAGGQQSASLTLNPPDLGPMQVVLNVTNSHATATFTAAQPEVRQALEAAMPKLREMLGDAGISLGQTSVNAGNAQQQQNFAGQSSQKSSGSVQAVDPVDTRIVANQPRQTSSGIGLVDTFA
jgi:flagellar hook-length control protein FliK